MRGLTIVAGALALTILGGGLWWMNQPDEAAVDAAVVVPELSPVAEEGRQAFAENCAACHGANAGGTEEGPPLVHPIYEPGHHGDLSFALAARNGVRSHHWRFGDMLPVEGITDEEIASITRYVRELQRANGIN